MELVSDRLTLVVYIANKSPHALFGVPGPAGHRVFCVKSLRDETKRGEWPATPKTILNTMLEMSTVQQFYDSPRAYVEDANHRTWRSLGMRCTGCGKKLREHR